MIMFFFNDYLTELKSKHIEYSEFINYINENKISQVDIGKDKLVIVPKENSDGKVLYTEKIDDPNLVERLNEAKVKYGGVPQESPLIKNLFTILISTIILILVWKFLFGIFGKKMGEGVMSFGKNTAKIYAENETGVNFTDVAGQEEAKESLVEIVDFLHNSQRYVDIGARLPKGALLVGPPGTGKNPSCKSSSRRS
jgi:cell division protease FtsH